MTIKNQNMNLNGFPVAAWKEKGYEETLCLMGLDENQAATVDFSALKGLDYFRNSKITETVTAP